MAAKMAAKLLGNWNIKPFSATFMCNTSIPTKTYMREPFMLLLWRYIENNFEKWCILLIICMSLVITSGRKGSFWAEHCSDCKRISSKYFFNPTPQGISITYLLHSKLNSLNVLRNSRWPPWWLMTWVGKGICKLANYLVYNIVQYHFAD